MSIIDIEEEAKIICTRLYYGWVEREELSNLAKDALLYRTVQDRLNWIGLELIDRPECPWYVVRVKQEHDSFMQFRRRNQSLKGAHLALILILFAKLLLPKRVGQVNHNQTLTISFEEIYEKYGHKFARSPKIPTSKKRMESFLGVLITQGFIIKKRAENIYLAGPSMYMLHEDLLTDLAKASLETLFGFGIYKENITK
ncbi:hypothetical protein [Paenibacillus polymyxa]|uniref:hypothetical protein n=1 Tax=Paenibacillus polymyxa TaxID=1406 RepID=UPI00287F9709|nr:hypothetical protein [Paenibacillus polymyxa]